jgi:hypothetical protein
MANLCTRPATEPQSMMAISTATGESEVDFPDSGKGGGQGQA